MTKEVSEILEESDSSTSIEHVDKLHRVGATKGNRQDIVVRFTNHSAKERFFLRRKNIKKKGVKVRPSLAPARRELLNEAFSLLNNYGDDQYPNLPHFVFADMNGDLKVKMTHRVGNRLFFNFKSIVELCQIIESCQVDAFPSETADVTDAT